MELIPKDEVLDNMDKLMKSPWFLDGKGSNNSFSQSMYFARKDAFEMIREFCVESVESPKMDTPFCPYCGAKRSGDDA